MSRVFIIDKGLQPEVIDAEDIAQDFADEEECEYVG